MYEQGGQTITTFFTRQMLRDVLRKVELFYPGFTFITAQMLTSLSLEKFPDGAL